MELDQVDHSAGPSQIMGAVLLLHIPDFHSAVAGTCEKTHTKTTMSRCRVTRRVTASIVTFSIVDAGSGL